MTDGMDGVLFTDGRSRIFLHPPKPQGPGFRHQVDLVGGPFRGAIEASSYAGPHALCAFHGELVELYKSLSGEARLPFTYENLKIHLSGDGLGHVTVKVDALAGVLMEVRLSFDFEIDQTQLPKIIADLERHFLKDAASS